MWPGGDNTPHLIDRGMEREKVGGVRKIGGGIGRDEGLLKKVLLEQIISKKYTYNTIMCYILYVLSVILMYQLTCMSD